MQLTEVLVKEGTRSDDNPLASSSSRTCSAHMCLRNDGHMHPISLTPQFFTFPRTRKGVINFALRSIDVLDRRRGAERGLLEHVKLSAMGHLKSERNEMRKGLAPKSHGGLMTTRSQEISDL